MKYEPQENVTKKRYYKFEEISVQSVLNKGMLMLYQSKRKLLLFFNSMVPLDLFHFSDLFEVRHIIK